MISTKTTSDHKAGGNTKTPASARMYCFTLNNWTDEEFTHLHTVFENKKNFYFVIGKEVGEYGTSHLQGFVKCKNGIKFDWLKKLCNRLHIEKCKGNEIDNIKYCIKDNNYISNYDDEYIDKCKNDKVCKGTKLNNSVDIYNKARLEYNDKEKKRVCKAWNNMKEEFESIGEICPFTFKEFFKLEFITWNGEILYNRHL